MNRRALQFDLTSEDQELFLAEIDELLQRLEECLVELERGPNDQALLKEIFRAAHTIKGSSATIGHTRMASLTHAMESRLDEMRKGVASVTPQLVAALLEALDVLKVLRDEVETRVPAEVDVEAAAAALEGHAATHRLTVLLEDGPWAAVRALQVLLALGEHGSVVSSEPARAEIEREDATIPSRITVMVRSDQPEHVLLEALSAVPELASIASEGLTAPASSASAVTPVSVEERASYTATGAPSNRGSSATIRIDVARLDALLDLVGELVIDRTRLIQLANVLAERFDDDRTVGDLQQTALHIGRITDELQEQVMKSRMRPIESVFSRLPRVVRDVASKQGKQVEFIVEGQDTELDRSVIEEIGDPLLHLIRNAVDHGLEPAEERLASGKPATGRLRLSACHADSMIEICLQDDGKGIDIQAVKRKALERGVVSQEHAERLSDMEAVQLIFTPGLSTAQRLSDVSGRGVGMDVVRANVEKINGSVSVETCAGRGTTFTIRLPLTLAIVQALLVRVAGGIYALPMHSVTETLRVEPEYVHQLHRREAMLLRGQVLPLLSMRGVLGFPSSDGSTLTDQELSRPPQNDDRRLVVAVSTPHRQVGLIVDALVGEQDIVIKPLSPLVGNAPGISGAAILGDGSLALIVDVAALIAQASS